MKKILVVLIVVALAIVAVGTANAAITNTKHNLASSNSASNPAAGTINEICVYCHTPHGGTQAAGQPLWNRNASTTAGFSPYSSTTLSTTPNNASNPASLVCFSCHDGVTSVNALRNYNGSVYSTGNTTVPGNYNIGGDAATLSNDHPVGMAIPTTKPDNTYKLPSGAVLFAYNATGTVECSTCHAVHGVGVIPNLLRVSNTLSALCLDCHVK